METWKTIPGYSIYQASTLGRLKTFNWRNSGREAIMKPALDNSGYLRTMLKRDSDGVIHTIKVHRIIAITFIDNPEKKPEINHKNGIKTDNRPINLEWVTRSENIKDAFDNNLQDNRGEHNPCATLTDEQAQEIRDNYPKFKRKSRHDGYPTKKEIAEDYGVSVSVIKQLVQKKTWKHLL